MRFVGALSVALSLFLGLTSCEDKEKVALSNKQKREIEVLRSEVDVLDKDLDGELIYSYDSLPLLLDDAESALNKEKLKVSGLEALQKQAEKEREEAEKDFEAYKKKYSVGS